MTKRETTHLLNVTVETITPDKAAFYLGSNVRNRPISQSFVNDLAAAMKRGEWRITHQGIAFDTKNHLIDGQHRLKAIIVADIPVSMTVHRDVDPETFDVIDVGRKRKFGDILALNGEISYTALAAATMAKWKYDTGNFFGGRKYGSASLVALEDVLARNPNLREHTTVVNGLEPKRLVHPSIAIWLSYEFSCIDPSASQRFWNGVGKGLELPEGSPIVALRSRLFEAISSARGTSIDSAYVAAWIIKAWNAWYTGKELRLIRFADGEKFPEIVKSRVPSKKPDDASL